MAVITERTGAKCARCGGSIVAEADGSQKCLSCGEEVAAPARARDVKPQSWTTVALAELRGILAEIQDLERRRLEAERIAKALTAAEVPNIPELPWKTRGAAAKAAAPRTMPSCAKCGRAFSAGPQYRKLEDGSAVCRAGCPENGKEQAS